MVYQKKCTQLSIFHLNSFFFDVLIYKVNELAIFPKLYVFKYIF